MRHIAVDLYLYLNCAGCDVDCLQEDNIASFAPGSLTLDAEYTAPHRANIVARWQYISVWLRIRSAKQVYISHIYISHCQQYLTGPKSHIPLCWAIPMSGAVLCNVAGTTCGQLGTILLHYQNPCISHCWWDSMH